jgi:hypothetical protein
MKTQSGLKLFLQLALLLVLFSPTMFAADVYVRFKMSEPAGTTYYLKLGGFIHSEPWYLRAAAWPENADKDAAKRIPAGEFTPWFDLGKHAGKALHGRHHRAGGVAEFPNVTADFITTQSNDNRRVVIELATEPDEKKVVKQFEESFRGSLTSFLVSPDLDKDKDSLETAGQMTARRLTWAQEATAGKRFSPNQHLIQTSFWSPQRPELNLKEAQVVSLLGFNMVGNQAPEVRQKFQELRRPGHTHDVDFGPGVTRDAIDQLMKRHAERYKDTIQSGMPFNFSDEICCRPPIGTNTAALANFRAWLEEKKIRPKDLGAEKLGDVMPIETPAQLAEREKINASAARRVFYYASRFRQEAGTERIRWHTEAFHKYFPPGPVTSTLVADHPYFGGTGLGMGIVPNFTWGGHPLALDWFDMARKKAVDMAGIEDWMGLQYMYGPGATWEGFQLMGFQSAIFRSGSTGDIPIMAWITPSDKTNLVLKTSSALCQGTKHFFYWTYGPTATSTENYWSDLRSAYDGIARITRQLAKAEHITGPGKTRKTKVALLYSISSDLWQPFGYIHMLERRATYLSLIHGQYLVDMLTEQDIEAGRLGDYKVLYVTDPNITEKATALIAKWVRKGGFLYGSCGAGSRNEFNEETDGLAPTFGIQAGIQAKVQDGNYRTRCGLNPIPYLDEITMTNQVTGVSEPTRFGTIGMRIKLVPKTCKVIGTLKDGSSAVVTRDTGKGRAIYFAGCPGLSYLKDAKFVPVELKEKYPAVQRSAINSWACAAGTSPLVELSHPVVEAGIYDSDRGAALVLGNFTYEPIEALTVKLPLPRNVRVLHSVEKGELKFSTEPASKALRDAGFAHVVTFTVPLGLNDIVLAEY